MSETRLTHEDDGYLIDTETGEVVGLAGPAGGVEHDRHQWSNALGMEVLTDAAAEAILDRRQALDATLAGMKARRAAILANLDAMEKATQNRLDWLQVAHGAELESWCRHRIAGGKARSVRTPFGTVGLRKLPARLEVIDPDEALLWAEANDPERVIVTRRLHTAGLIKRDDLPETAFRIVEPSERCYVKTGVEEAGNGAE